MNPIDYSIDVQSPIDAALKGYQAGAVIRNDQMQQQQQQVQLAQQQQMQAELAALSRNPTPQGILQATLRYPQLSEQFKRANDMLTTQQQEAQSRALLPIYFAAQSGNVDVARDQLEKRALALDNSGKPQDAQEARDMAKLLEMNPGSATVTLGGYLAHTLGPEKFAETFGKLGTELRALQLHPSVLAKSQAEAAKTGSEATTAAVTANYAESNAQADLKQKAAQLGLTGAQVRDIGSQITTRAGQLGLDREKLNLETNKFLFEKQQKLQDIGQDGRKLVNDSAVASGAAKLSADRANDLAGRLDNVDAWTGATGTFSEWLKKATGSQDAVTELRTQYTALRNSEGVKNLPPGPASDNDVKMALDGIPPPTANPKVMQSWLRGVAKLNDINAAIENARADYAANNKGLLGKARTSFEAGGTDVTAGDSWMQISKRVAETAARKYVAAKDRVQPPSGAALIPGSGTPEANAQAAAAAGAAPGRVIDWSTLRDR